jgi:hypothetical protein
MTPPPGFTEGLGGLPVTDLPDGSAHRLTAPSRIEARSRPVAIPTFVPCPKAYEGGTWDNAKTLSRAGQAFERQFHRASPGAFGRRR